MQKKKKKTISKNTKTIDRRFFDLAVPIVPLFDLDTQSLKLPTTQIFSGSSRNWSHSPEKDEDISG